MQAGNAKAGFARPAVSQPSDLQPVAFSQLAEEVLRELETHGPLSTAAIDGDLHLKSGHAGAVMRELWAHGLVVQDGDTHMSRWSLTPIGQDYLDALPVTDG